MSVFQETESSILEAEPLVGKGVAAALFLAGKKGNFFVNLNVLLTTDGLGSLFGAAKIINAFLPRRLETFLVFPRCSNFTADVEINY